MHGNGVCKKNFPKEFREEILENVNGYPPYKQRNNGRTVRVGGFIVDNRYIVPYNVGLLKNTNHISISKHVHQ